MKSIYAHPLWNTNVSHYTECNFLSNINKASPTSWSANKNEGFRCQQSRKFSKNDNEINASVTPKKQLCSVENHSRKQTKSPFLRLRINSSPCLSHMATKRKTKKSKTIATLRLSHRTGKTSHYAMNRFMHIPYEIQMYPITRSAIFFKYKQSKSDILKRKQKRRM